MNRLLVQCQQKTILSNLDKIFLDGSLDILTGLNNEQDVNNKDLNYASASKPKAVVGLKKTVCEIKL